MAEEALSSLPRKAEYPVDHEFLERWSPRAMTGQDILEEDLMTLFEAARWAPSNDNTQPWRFLYARRSEFAWPLFFDLLDEGNHKWAGRASALIVVVSAEKNEATGKPLQTHSYDTGAAWMSLALEGHHKGLAVHGMAGFDHEKARKNLRIPEGYRVEAMAAVGYPDSPEVLPDDLRRREKPSLRMRLDQFVFAGGWPESC
jgi:nitroreductase